jgi:hypothetical protein
MPKKEFNMEITKSYVIAWIFLIIAVILLYQEYWIGWICYYLSLAYSIVDICNPLNIGPGEPPKAA